MNNPIICHIIKTGWINRRKSVCHFVAPNGPNQQWTQKALLPWLLSIALPLTSPGSHLSRISSSLALHFPIPLQPDILFLFVAPIKTTETTLRAKGSPISRPGKPKTPKAETISIGWAKRPIT